ncbi:hypothetical protein KIN20_002801 [Parelaphostrongylus tenuis]|uniref:Major facilitator superfamily (MFS) profile domain-containing protein n=1 Tax=Parelaphostrongylus tenuis TaxID=148309 RepID=A0AAD5MH68_PARTN|nr:hypothetical protein KIN20_002801 [Parelaphostrongylus tenuis]
MNANLNILGFTVICMEDVVHSQSTNETEEGHWLNDPKKKSVLFSVIAIGQLLGTFPIVSLMRIMGMRYTFSIYAILSAIATLALPLAVELGHLFLTVIRFIQGFSVAITIVSFGAVAHSGQLLRSLLPISPYFPALGAVLVMPVAGVFCESLGWRPLYYLFGTIGLLSTAAFFYLYRDDPRKHRMVSAKELKAITAGKEGQQERGPVPYMKICKDPCIQAVLLFSLSSIAIYFIFVFFGPTFMNKALGVEIANTGYLNALPQALAIALKLIMGPIFDISTFLSMKNRLRVFALLTQGVAAVCLFVVSQNPGKVLTQVAYCAAGAFNGLNVVAGMKCLQMVARQHVHFVLVCVTIGGCVTSFAVPPIVAVVCPNNTVDEWSTLFLGASIFVAISAVPFILLAKSEPAPWTISTSPSTSNTIQNVTSERIAVQSRATIVPSDSSQSEHNRHANVHRISMASEP